MTTDQRIFPLEGVIQHYAWGGVDYIPQLIGQENPSNEPFAELWMGVHHRGPARIKNGDQWLLLKQFIDTKPEEVIGTATHQHFGPQLPYLFKILDVRQMLSIQAHPSKERAEAGFKQENDQGIPLEAPHRTYKDANHKPEIMVALTEFWLLHGFMPIEKMAKQLSLVPELTAVHHYFQKHGQDIQSLYQWIMEMPQAEIDATLIPLRNRLVPLYEHGKFNKNQPEFWAARAFSQFHPLQGECDRGILSIFLMNIVEILPGQGIYQDAGVLHAYLEGVNVELMASSDNVFRGGLTVKHVNVPELMENISFSPIIPNIILGEQPAPGITTYSTPAPDFELSCMQIYPDEPIDPIHTHSPEILIVTEGSVSINDTLNRKRGECFFVQANTEYEVRSENGAVLFRAGVPNLDA